MQPQIKESVGGLRDAQLIFWIAQTIYGIGTLKDLTGQLFSEEEYREYRMALELLFRVRSALHLIHGKQEDRLLLDSMPQITTMLGFKETRKMATQVLKAQWRINNFTQIFVKKMVRPFIADMSYVSKFRHNRIQKGIYELEGRLFSSYNLQPLPIKKLLEILVALPDKDYRFDAGFLNQFTYSPIKHPLSSAIYSLIKELFAKKHMYCFLKLFYDAGILHELFSSFKKVLHLPQFDGYHTYPVDIHSIKCVEALENIQEPFIKDLYNSFEEEEKLVLKLVVLAPET